MAAKVPFLYLPSRVELSGMWRISEPIERAAVIVCEVEHGEKAEAGSTTTVVTDETAKAGQPNADEGKPRGQSRFPEHPELYLPMPIPESTEKPRQLGTENPELPTSHEMDKKASPQ